MACSAFRLPSRTLDARILNLVLQFSKTVTKDRKQPADEGMWVELCEECDCTSLMDSCAS